jgi:serine protease Do
MERRLADRLTISAASAALVTEVQTDSAASKADVRAGDIIIKAAGQSIVSPDDLQIVLGRHPLGTPLVLEIVRGNERLTIEALPTELNEAA